MATSVISRILAALAALFILASCGGGSDVAPQQVSVQAAPFVGTPVAGTTVGGSTRRQALAASSEVTRPTFDVSFQPTATANAFVKKSALAVATASEAITNDELFNWAEGEYPQYFPFHQSTRNGEYSGVNYDFRCYSTLADNCVGVAQSGADIGGIYGIGPYTGGALVRFGHIGDDAFRCAIAYCGPELQSAKLMDMKTGVAVDANGATGVAAKGTKLVLSYDQVDCTGVGGTGVVGQLILTISCDRNVVTFVPGIPGEERWTFGSDVTVSAAGLRNAAGYPSRLVEVTFSTKVAAAGQGAKVYTGNWFGKSPVLNQGNAMSIFDVTTETLVRQIDYPDVPGYQILNGQVAVDPVAGVVYQAPWSGNVIYRVDLEDGSILTPIWIDRNSTSNQDSRGLVVVGSEVCQVLGVPNFEGQYYYLDNALACFNTHTLTNTFMSGRGYVADVSMIATGMHSAPGRGKLYVTNTARSAYFLEQTPWGVRDGWQLGTRGTVTEIDATTHLVSRTFEVGSAPTGPFVDEQAGKLYVFNMGSGSVSVVNLTSGTVTSTPLAMSGFERPATALPDWEKNRIYVSDDAGTVRVLHPGTLQEIGRINLGGNDIAAHMVIVRGKLWVASSLQNIGAYNDKVIIINRDTLAVEKKIINRSSLSGAPDQPYAITAYDPGP